MAFCIPFGMRISLRRSSIRVQKRRPHALKKRVLRTPSGQKIDTSIYPKKYFSKSLRISSKKPQ